jgi:hypothetical protein
MKIFKALFGLGLVLFLANAAYAQDWVGKITEAQGQITVVRAGQSLAAKLSSGILPGDEIATGPGARAKIWFKDESVITLSEKSRFKVDALEYNPGSSRRSMFTLVTGKAKALVSGWFGAEPEQQYQIRALSTVAGVRGTEFIVQIKGEGQNAAAFFATISGTITLWDVNHPDRRVSLPANFFMEILNGSLPGMTQQMTEQFLMQFNQGFIVTESRDERGQVVTQQIFFNIVPPATPGGPVIIQVIPAEPGLESNRTDVTNPADTILNGNVTPPNFVPRYTPPEVIIPPGTSQITIKIDPGDLHR